MKSPLTLAATQALSQNDTTLKPLLRETYRFPDGALSRARGNLRLQAIQRIDDIVMFHQFAMFTHMQSNELIAPVFEAFNEHYGRMFDNMGDDQEKISSTRLAFRNFNEVAQLEQIQCIANESLVINLWATIEQILTRCLEIIENPTPGNRAPHRWDIIEKHYTNHNANLNKASSYSTINELRILNNKIKHSYIVDKDLIKFEHFKNHENKRINTIPLRTFDYTLAAYNFVCFITNRTGESIFYPENEEDDYDDYDD
ncbi:MULTISPECIES: hypothetical protein [Pseudomonas]|uniref:hypothetical protein n=1 Tax=Pseudomonas TaxID=286 RepID=UPI0010428280|nr:MULTISPECIES: hypothetical protein [Pseudomonas]KAA8694477.1 hypothetical protein F4W61_29125 [Pseudomonas proteolytica]TWR71059.1 hypothetical protein FIV38_29245 [Pseudomonas proteolytica]